MNQYSEQIERIKQKIIQAKTADPMSAVFGADHHRYFVGPPINEQRVRAFEQQYKIDLPLEYKLFVTQVGNGGNSFRKSAAGPFYGIYRLGEEVDEIIEDPLTYLSEPNALHPKISDEAWSAFIERAEADDVSDEEFTTCTNQIFQGLLPIGSQGCTYVTALVVSGDYKGRIVNVDLDCRKPWFSYEANFLDWYERWLDEILLGYLQPEGSLWFGSVMGGTEQKLIEQYADASEEEKQECLRGFFKIPTVSLEAIEFLVSESDNRNKPISELALQSLTKFDYKRAQSRLKNLFSQMPLNVLQYVHWYAKEFASDWVIETQTLLKNGIDDAETFRFASYVVTGTHSEIQELLAPYAIHPDKEIRDQAAYKLSEYKPAQFVGSAIKKVKSDSDNRQVEQSSKITQIFSAIKSWFYFI